MTRTTDTDARFSEANEAALAAMKSRRGESSMPKLSTFTVQDAGRALGILPRATEGETAPTEDQYQLLEQAMVDARKLTKGSTVSGGDIAVTAALIYGARLVAEQIRDAIQTSKPKRKP